ncbi:hypothetical protein B296_00000716 [Ensete ventricosum]|uniref:Uncharacterized protein n=1 Tax=Ensete ventricosum TaxID=4639 RepID=A0A427AIM9_ENSVE|nr:hypothetical protein B296_00000716 [Ensete ventricosum]
MVGACGHTQRPQGATVRGQDCRLQGRLLAGVTASRGSARTRWRRPPTRAATTYADGMQRCRPCRGDDAEGARGDKAFLLRKILFCPL